MPLTQQNHYIVGYHDNQLHHHEICEYAMSAYDAIKHSTEDVPMLKEHPSFVEYCRNNSEIDNISRLMAAGIPMGH